MAMARAIALVLFALLQVQPARAQSCDVGKAKGPVSILILASPQKVQEFAATIRDAPVAARDPGTVIFRDGRVVTSDAASATRHLNALGWGGRPIEIVASFRLRPMQAPGGYG
jgi:hypothetical protein